MNKEDKSGFYNLLKDWLTTLPVSLILLFVVFVGIGESFHSQLVNLGISIWGGNYVEFRQKIKKPECDPNPNIDKIVERKYTKRKKESRTGSLGLIQKDPPERSAIRKAVKKKRAECREAWKEYRNKQENMTLALFSYLKFESWVAYAKNLSFTFMSHFLVLLIFLSAFRSTIARHHVVLRPQKTVMDHWVSTSFQLVANLTLFIAASSYWYSSYKRSGPIDNPYLHALWIAGFGILTFFSIKQLIQGVPDEDWPTGKFRKTFTTVPLYAYIVIISGVYYLILEGYPSGMAIQLRKVEQFSSLYIKVGLYVWAGMLLKGTRLTDLAFDALKPWKFPPEFFAIIVVFLAGYPTAYTGASGIFVIAAGAIIFEELRKADARGQLAIASTAMAGGGVVLEPCFLIVIIAALNDPVTTSQLFGWGFYVFLLIVFVFAILVLITKRNKIEMAPVSEALKPTLRRLVPLIPYALSVVFVIVSFYYLLATSFNEFSAPIMVPFMLLVMLFYDEWAYGNGEVETESGEKEFSLLTYLNDVRLSIREATSESINHIGSILMLMVMTVIFGGFVQRAELMGFVPENFASPWTTMIFMVFVLVIIGMSMDPYGASILVSVTFAPLAYRNGINAVHFWLVVVTAFELGYLTPPVALNQQFTRMVVGEDKYEEALESVSQDESFWRHYEYLLLPIAALTISLLIVAFCPLFFYV